MAPGVLVTGVFLCAETEYLREVADVVDIQLSVARTWPDLVDQSAKDLHGPGPGRLLVESFAQSPGSVPLARLDRADRGGSGELPGAFGSRRADRPSY